MTFGSILGFEDTEQSGLKQAFGTEMSSKLFMRDVQVSNCSVILTPYVCSINLVVWDLHYFCHKRVSDGWANKTNMQKYVDAYSSSWCKKNHDDQIRKAHDQNCGEKNAGEEIVDETLLLFYLLGSLIRFIWLEWKYESMEE